MIAAMSWHCEPNFLTCAVGHPLRFKEASFRVDLRAVEGAAFLDCRKCEPPSYFVVLFVARPYPLATCYALSEDSYKHWLAAPMTIATPELLHVLRDPEGRSLNPHWRPAQ